MTETLANGYSSESAHQEQADHTPSFFRCSHNPYAAGIVLASRASRCHLDTKAPKNHPSGLHFYLGGGGGGESGGALEWSTLISIITTIGEKYN